MCPRFSRCTDAVPYSSKHSRSGVLSNPRNKFSLAFILAAGILLAACAPQSYHPEPLDPDLLLTQRAALDHADPEFRTFVESHDYPIKSWPLAQFDLSALTLAAMYFNPSIQVARSRIAVAQAGEMIAGQRPNPTLNFPDEPRDTLDFYGLVADLVFERKAKRLARIARAQAEREAAELALARQAWQLYTKLHSGLIEYYGAERITQLLTKQHEILSDSLALLEQRLEFGEASEFEVSSVRLELQQTVLLLANQQYLVNDAFHRLIANTGLQVSGFERGSVVFSDLQEHLAPQIAAPGGLRLTLLNSRMDLQQKLVEYQAYEAGLKLEIEKQYPNVTLSPGLLFEEGQALWVLAAAAKLPVFHNNDGQIQRALAERKQKQHEFIQLQSSLLTELARAQQNYQDRLGAYEKSRLLFSALLERGNQIEKQVELGSSDRLALLRSRLEIEKARRALFQIELDAMRAARQLEAVTQSPLPVQIKAIDFMQSSKTQEIHP